MRKILSIIIGFFCFPFLAFAATQEISQSMYDSTNGSAVASNSNYWLQTFTAPLGSIEIIEIEIKGQTWWSSRTVYLDLYEADGSDNPTGSALYTTSWNSNEFGNSPGSWQGRTGLTISVTPSQKYALLVRGGDPGSIDIQYKNDTNPYSGGKMRYSTNAGVSWTDSTTGDDLAFDVIFEVEEAMGGNGDDEVGTDFVNFALGSHDPSLPGQIQIPAAGDPPVSVPVFTCTDMTDQGEGDYECTEWSLANPVPFVIDGTMFYNLAFFILTVCTVLIVIRFYFSRAGK